MWTSLSVSNVHKKNVNFISPSYVHINHQAVLWNDLPDDFKKISNFNQFKNILKSWNGNVCKCSACADF